MLKLSIAVAALLVSVQGKDWCGENVVGPTAVGNDASITCFAMIKRGMSYAEKEVKVSCLPFKPISSEQTENLRTNELHLHWTNGVDKKGRPLRRDVAVSRVVTTKSGVDLEHTPVGLVEHAYIRPHNCVAFCSKEKVSKLQAWYKDLVETCDGGYPGVSRRSASSVYSSSSSFDPGSSSRSKSRVSRSSSDDEIIGVEPIDGSSVGSSLRSSSSSSRSRGSYDPFVGVEPIDGSSVGRYSLTRSSGSSDIYSKDSSRPSDWVSRSSSSSDIYSKDSSRPSGLSQRSNSVVENDLLPLDVRRPSLTNSQIDLKYPQTVEQDLSSGTAVEMRNRRLDRVRAGLRTDGSPTEAAKKRLFEDLPRKEND